MLQEELKEAQAENEMLKKQLEKAEEQVEEAIHMLRDQVLGGDLELQLNGSLSKFHDTEFEVQVDKTEFMERYERSLSALSKLTKHQESKLRQLHMPYSKEIHMSAPAGPEQESSKVAKDRAQDSGRFETSVWDTDSNDITSPSQRLLFDPRLHQATDVAAADPTEELRDTSEPDRWALCWELLFSVEEEADADLMDTVNVQQGVLLEVWGSEDDGAFLSGDFLGECWLPPLGSLTAASKRYVLPLTNAPPETGYHSKKFSKVTCEGHLIVDASWTFPSETVPPLPDVKREEIMHTGKLKLNIIKACCLSLEADVVTGTLYAKLCEMPETPRRCSTVQSIADFGAERSQISLKDFLDIFFPRQEPLDMATPSAAENGEVVTSLDDSLQADNEMLKRELQETQDCHCLQHSG
eukprot:g16728.t1